MRVALLLWPDTFEDWYKPLGIDRATYLESYDAEWSVGVARLLVDAGVDVHLVFATLDGTATEVHRPSGASVHFVRAAPLYRAFRTAVWGHRQWERASTLWPAAPVLSTISPALLGRLVSLRPDVCIVQDYESLRFDLAGPLLRALGQRVVGMDAGGSARPRTGRFHRWAAGRAHRLLAVNASEARRAREQLHHADVHTWRVPVRTDVFRPADRRAARHALGVDPDTPLVVSVGRLHPVKGLHDLADACAGLDCTLVLAGAGDEHDALAARRQANLRLAGWVAPDVAAQWYAAADVVALASRTEGQPIALLEAFACGRGVVATAVGGVPEVVLDGETGWLVPAYDVESLCVALKDAITDVDEADRRGERGRALVETRYSPEVVSASLAELLTIAR